MDGISFILDGVINGISNFVETNIAGVQYLIDEIINSEKRYKAECLRKSSRIYLLKKQEPYIPPVIVERQSHTEETKDLPNRNIQTIANQEGHHGK